MEFRYSFLLVAGILVGLTRGQIEDIQNEMFRTKKYCGSHLAQALAAICRGNYNTLFKKQESYSNKNWDGQQYVADMPQEEDGLSHPFQKRSTATSMMGGQRRRRRRRSHGVYNECCEKSCSQEELSSYCASPSRRRRWT